MGLFSFVKNAGAKLFSRKKEQSTATKAPVLTQEQMDSAKADELLALINALGLKIENPYIAVEDDIVTIAGISPSQAEKEKVILAAGNVSGIAQVNDQIELAKTNASEKESAPVVESVFHTVVKGDSLSKISKQYYGDYMKYMVIFEANKPMLKDPDLIYPGQSLRIPALEV